MMDYLQPVVAFVTENATLVLGVLGGLLLGGC